MPEDVVRETKTISIVKEDLDSLDAAFHFATETIIKERLFNYTLNIEEMNGGQGFRRHWYRLSLEGTVKRGEPDQDHG